MSVSDGQNANAATLNSAFASKTANNSLAGKQTLNREGSGAAIDDLQQTVNDNSDAIDTLESTVEGLEEDVENAVEVVAGADGRLTALEEGLPSGDDYLQLEELSSDPATPSAGKKRLFAKNDGKVYTRDSAGNIAEVGSGAGGSGGIDFFEGGDFESGIGLASTYDDTGAYVDGTGGSPTVITIAEETSLPLVGAKSLRISKAASDASGEGVTLTPETIDLAYRGQPLFFRFYYDGSAGAYTSGDLKIKAYDVTNSTTLLVQPVANLDSNSGLLKAANIQGIAKISPSSTTAQVRVSLHLASDSNTGSGWNINIDEAKLGPDSPTPTPVEADLGTEVWTDSQANATTSVKLYRKGKWLTAKGTTTFTGAASGATTVTIPSAYTADTNVYPQAVFDFVGDVYMYDSGGLSAQGPLALSSLTQLTLLANNVSSTYDGIVNTSATVPFTWASGDKIEWEGRWVVSGWSTGNLMSSFEASLRTLEVEATSTAGQSISDNTVSTIVFGTEAKDNFNSYNNSTGVFTAPANQRLTFSAGAQLTSLTAETGEILLYLYEGASIKRTLYNSRVGSGTQLAHGSTTINVTKGLEYTIKIVHNNGAARSLSSNAANVYLSIKAEPDLTHTGAYQGGPPTITRLTSGSGTYNPPSNVRFLRIKMVGGGGGGAGGGTAAGTSATAGGNTTFGTSLLVANGGAGALNQNGAGGAGGSASLGTGPIGMALTGASGNGGQYNASSGAHFSGGTGGVSPFGGAGQAGGFSNNGGNAVSNTGSGGGGGGTNGTSLSYSGSGGGAGGYVEAQINYPQASYSYAVGSGGSGGSGTGTTTGGTGGSGVIIIEEHY